LVFSLSSVLCPLSSGFARAQGEAHKPYQLQVVLHVAQHRLLTDVFRDRVERELRDGLQASLGELARVEVVRDHPRLKEVLDRGLQRALDGWKERSEVKTHFVLIDFSGTHYEIQARQHDGLTGQASPVVRRDRTRDRDFVARAASLLVDRDFGLVGTVAAPAGGEETFKVELRGGALDVPIERWVKKGDVFAVVPELPGSGAVQALDFALLQVEQPPVATNRDGVCVCRFFHRRKVGSIVGYRCLKMATTTAPVRLRVAQLKPDGSAALLQDPLMVQVRRNGFDKDAPAFEQATDPAGAFETLQRGGQKVLFDNVAFVTILKDRKPLAQVPLALVEDRTVSLAVPVTNDPGALLAERRDAWMRDVFDSYLVQTSIFKEVNELGAKADKRAQALKRAEDGVKRTHNDHGRLSAERQELLDEARKTPGLKAPDLTVGDNYLQKLKAGGEELEGHIARMKKIDAEENDPTRKKWLAQVEQGKLLEKDLEYGKAIALYEQVLKEGFPGDDLRKHVEYLKKLWETADPNLKVAREFIYDVWPGLDTPGLQKKIGDAEKALEACKAARDFVGPQKMLKAADAHVIRLSKELDSLSDVNIDDVEPIKVIKELTPRLASLIKATEEYLKKAPPPEK
jgi:hypothetical protein